jgi:hypothetical protein
VRIEPAGYVVNAVVLGEGGGPGHWVSKSWLYEVVARFRDGGEEGLKPRSKRPCSPLRRVVGELEEEAVELGKSLTEEGLDTGAHTVQYARWPGAGVGPRRDAVGVVHQEGPGPARLRRHSAPKAAPGGHLHASAPSCPTGAGTADTTPWP